MVVESQLCPQCGAAIQFVDGQTKIICAYCGTTVVRPATSIEKELAAEKLVQETVGLEKKLDTHGHPAIGKIIAAQTTDIFRQTVEGQAVLMTFALQVQPDSMPAFVAEAKALIALTAVDKYQAGTLLDVRYDPQDHTRVAIVGRHGVHLNNDNEEWKQRIANWAADAFRKEQGVDLRKDPQAMQRLLNAAAKAIDELASAMETDLNLPFITADAKGPKHLNLRLSRAQFEQITKD